MPKTIVPGHFISSAAQQIILSLNYKQLQSALTDASVNIGFALETKNKSEFFEKRKMHWHIHN